jgi:hypothetical protein
MYPVETIVSIAGRVATALMLQSPSFYRPKFLLGANVAQLKGVRSKRVISQQIDNQQIISELYCLGVTRCSSESYQEGFAVVLAASQRAVFDVTPIACNRADL